MLFRPGCSAGFIKVCMQTSLAKRLLDVSNVSKACCKAAYLAVRFHLASAAATTPMLCLRSADSLGRGVAMVLGCRKQGSCWGLEDVQPSQLMHPCARLTSAPRHAVRQGAPQHLVLYYEPTFCSAAVAFAWALTTLNDSSAWKRACHSSGIKNLPRLGGLAARG